MKKTLWTKNYSLLMGATVLGSIGGIAGNFALSFLVFDETGSTLASALILAIEMVPAFVIPLLAAPVMDRLPRKPFLVAGDAVNGVLYALAGVYLLFCPFSYIGYLCFSLVLSSMGTFDSLAYNSIYPNLIPEGMEQKGYAVSSTLYPVLQVVMAPVAALLLETIGVAWILIIQGALSVLAALVESCIEIQEENRLGSQRFSINMWWEDVKEAARYLRQERGLRGIYGYSTISNGLASGYATLIVAFFRTAPGFTTAMYSLFSVAEFAGRSLGGVLHYHVPIPPKKKFSFAFGVYLIYELMDMVLLWLPYPAMLLNRGVCGFLGVNSATMRYAAVQKYIPDHLRARMNAFEDMLFTACASVLTLAVGVLGEVADYRVCMSICGLCALAACWLTIWKNRKEIRKIYEKEIQTG